MTLLVLPSRAEGTGIIAAHSRHAASITGPQLSQRRLDPGRRRRRRTAQGTRAAARRARGRGLGRTLTQPAIQFGRQAGYAAMRLDTLLTMVEARAMYRALGFQEISAYRFNPIPDTAFMELKLGPQA